MMGDAVHATLPYLASGYASNIFSSPCASLSLSSLDPYHSLTDSVTALVCVSKMAPF